MLLKPFDYELIAADHNVFEINLVGFRYAKVTIVLKYPLFSEDSILTWTSKK